MRPMFIGGACTVFVLAGAPAVRAQTESPSDEDHRAAVRRALSHLAQQTGTWIEQKKCTSCHQVPHALWAMNEARAAGFDVDDRLTEWNRWSVAFVLKEADESDKSGAHARERTDELYQLLLAGSINDIESTAEGERESADARKRLVALLELAQGEDGNWPAGGRLPGQKRPNQETNEATTLWSLLALQAHDGNTELSAERVKPNLAARSTSLEHLTLRYLLARHRGTSEQAAELQSQILSHQHGDGGWGWLLDGPSDALATGQALYALSYMDRQRRQDAVRRAHQYLVQTQQADGSWPVPSTLEEMENKPYEVANDWGTAWAVIGLMRTIEHQATERP